MLDFDENIESITNVQTLRKEQENHIKYLNELTFKVFELNSDGKEWLKYYVATMLMPLTDEQRTDLKFFMGTQQPFKNILQMIASHKQNIGGK